MAFLSSLPQFKRLHILLNTNADSEMCQFRIFLCTQKLDLMSFYAIKMANTAVFLL